MTTKGSGLVERRRLEELEEKAGTTGRQPLSLFDPLQRPGTVFDHERRPGHLLPL
ncbi:MAG TPA: hypothetical protein VNM90_04930 [Haliangium sp.]|nr:hypothetical protein [Haliangium sp.]